jgi:four helix bundle protein
MSFKFESLRIWQISMELGEEINSIAFDFPKSELYNLSSQFRRSADSVALNISEGSIGQSNPEFKRFIGYSFRSLAEFVTCLYKAKNRDYISEEAFSSLYDKCFNLMNMIISFKKNIR